jgi:hypothetical protein
VNAINLVTNAENDNFDVCTSFFCKICYVSFKTVDALVIHKSKNHSEALFKYVDNMFKSHTVKSESLDEDSIPVVVKREDEDITVSRINVCHICTFKAVTTCHLEFHMKSHMTSHPNSIKEEDKKIKPRKTPISLATKVSQVGEKISHLSTFDSKSHNWYPMLVPHDSQQKVLYNINKSNGNYCYTNNKSSSKIKSVARYVCAICSKMYRGHHSFNDHAVRAHVALIGHKDLLKIVYIDPKDDPFQKSNFGRPDKKYSCKVCGMSLKSKLDAQNHMISYHCDSESE